MENRIRSPRAGQSSDLSRKASIKSEMSHDSSLKENSNLPFKPLLDAVGSPLIQTMSPKRAIRPDRLLDYDNVCRKGMSATIKALEAELAASLAANRTLESEIESLQALLDEAEAVVEEAEDLRQTVVGLEIKLQKTSESAAAAVALKAQHDADTALIDEYNAALRETVNAIPEGAEAKCLSVSTESVITNCLQSKQPGKDVAARVPVSELRAALAWSFDKLNAELKGLS